MTLPAALVGIVTMYSARIGEQSGCRAILRIRHIGQGIPASVTGFNAHLSMGAQPNRAGQHPGIDIKLQRCETACGVELLSMARWRLRLPSVPARGGHKLGYRKPCLWISRHSDVDNVWITCQPVWITKKMVWITCG